ncbi:MAG: hypothetical protein ACI88G_002247 [Woeseiaceae bacterium]|jgi:hypothetical protein
MQYLSPIVTEDYENEKNSEGRRWRGEKVGGNDVFGVVFQKCPPSLRWRFPFSNQVFGYRCLGYVDAKLQEFPVDSRCQRITVSGLTMCKVFRHLGHSFETRTQKDRSVAES